MSNSLTYSFISARSQWQCHSPSLSTVDPKPITGIQTRWMWHHSIAGLFIQYIRCASPPPAMFLVGWNLKETHIDKENLQKTIDSHTHTSHSTQFADDIMPGFMSLIIYSMSFYAWFHYFLSLSLCVLPNPVYTVYWPWPASWPWKLLALFYFWFQYVIKAAPLYMHMPQTPSHARPGSGYLG